MAMTETRRKQLTRVRGIIKRMSKEYRVDENLYKNLTNLSTQKLRHMSRKSIIQSGQATHRSFIVKEFPEVTQSDYEEMEANFGLTKILRLLEKGANYSGEYSKKSGGKSARIAVNMSAERIENIVLEAKNRDGAKVVYDKLMKYYGSFSRIEEMVEALILGVYDDVYASWAQGSAAYEAELKRIAQVLGVVDRGF